MGIISWILVIIGGYIGICLVGVAALIGLILLLNYVFGLEKKKHSL